MAIKDWPGGVISKTPVVPAGTNANSAASGVWTLDQVAYWQKQGIWPNPANAVDPYFYDVTLLLTGDGTNGAQNNTFLDSSTNNFTITRNGNTTQGTFSPYGNLWSNYFDGNGDYLSLGTVASGGPLDLSTATFTLEAWVYISSLTSADERDVITSSAASVVTNSNVDWALRVTSTGYAALATCSGNNGLVVTSTPQLTVGWNHIAATRTSNSATVYVNGVGTTGTVYATTNTNRVVQIGQLGNIYSFAGYISNARVVKGTALYTSNFTPSTTPLTAVSGTSLLTCQSNRFIDNSSNNFTLTVGGNTSVQRFSPFNPTAAYDAATIGGSGYFDGSGDYLSIANNAALEMGTGSFTLEAWVYTPSFGASSIMLMDGSASGAMFFQLYSGHIGIGRAGVAWDLDASSALVIPNTWLHCVIVRDTSNTLSVYVNGTRVGTQTNTQNYGLQSGSFYVQRERTLNSSVVAYISNMRIVKGAAVYDPTQATLTVPTAPLTAVSGTSLLLNFTNAGIPDAAMMNDLETVGNAQVSTSVVKYGTGSLAFDGTGDYLYSVATPNTTLSGDFTIECWAYLSSTYSAYPALLTLGDSGSSGTGIEIQIWGSGATVYVNGVIAGSSTGMTNATNTWIHWAVVRSGNSIKIYKNGTSFGATGTNSTAFTGALRVGVEYYNSGLGNYWYGYIDDLRITKGYARYTANFTPPTAAFPTF